MIVGIDIKDITLVIYYQGIYRLIFYYQHIIRDNYNRIGAKSICLVLSKNKELLLKRIVRE